jgi:prepilin signal peptidase PulO-like enzyme (type II secretory pathway)
VGTNSRSGKPQASSHQQILIHEQDGKQPESVKDVRFTLREQPATICELLTISCVGDFSSSPTASVPEFMLCFLLLAQLKPAIRIQEPFPSPDQIWLIGAALIGLWLFAIGASVGSFINVVVYRLPAGLNLSSPGSRCPRCLHPIRLQHNVPIVGWLLLRGRCADCQLPISPRYPLVELLLGTVFLLVGGIELIGNGVNLPRPSAEFSRPVLSTQEPQALGAAVTMHLVLLATLVCAALIEHDGQIIPKRIALPVIALAIGVSLVWPAVHPIAALELVFSIPKFTRLSPEIRQPLQSPWLDIILGGIAGVLAVAAMMAAIGSRRWLELRYGGVLTMLWIAVGMVFGWQLVPFLLFSWAVVQIVVPKRDMSRDLRPILDLTTVVLLSLLIWRIVANYPQLLEPLPYAHPIAYGSLTLLAIGLLFVAARRLPLEYEYPQPVVDEAFLPTPPPVATAEPATSSEPATTIEDDSLSNSDSDEPKQP